MAAACKGGSTGARGAPDGEVLLEGLEGPGLVRCPCGTARPTTEAPDHPLVPLCRKNTAS